MWGKEEEKNDLLSIIPHPPSPTSPSSSPLLFRCFGMRAAESLRGGGRGEERRSEEVWVGEGVERLVGEVDGWGVKRYG